MVTRTAKAEEDGIGTLLIIVFSAPPFFETKSLEVARVLFRELDLSAKGAQHPYTIPGIPIREEAYWVVAIFDDDGDLNITGEPGLRNGDLVCRLGEAYTWPKVVVPDGKPVLLDIDLNAIQGNE